MRILDFFKVGQIKAENEELKKKVDELTALSNNLSNRLAVSENKYDTLHKSYKDLSATVSGEKINHLQQQINNLTAQKEKIINL